MRSANNRSRTVRPFTRMSVPPGKTLDSSTGPACEQEAARMEALALMPVESVF